MQHHLIHLICGSTGAGKTTYASRLSERLKGIRFSIDEWMATLFWMDTPQPLNPAWSMAQQIAARNVACILDLGFSQTQSRAKFAGLAQAAGLTVQLHFIDVPAEERWQRVETRNARKGETYQLGFDVTREMFDFVETMWEPPDDREMAACDGIRVSD